MFQAKSEKERELWMNKVVNQRGKSYRWKNR